MDPSVRIYVAGGDTLLGRALRERLHAAGFRNLVGQPPDEPDLTCPGQVEDFFAEARPAHVFVAAGKSGGIHANQSRPAELMLDNLLVSAHVIHQAWRHGVRKLLYLASACAYPRNTPQPMPVEALLSGPLEPSSAAYATAKLAGWKLCEAYRRQYSVRFLTAFPANPFGPGDDFRPEAGHVIPGLLRRLHEARENGAEEVLVWGTGTPRREFLYAPDLADACLFVMRRYEGPGPINLGGGTDLSIAETARLVAEVVGYRGRLRFDPSRPDGAPRKALDAGPLLTLGWRPATPFRTALEATYVWFLSHVVKEDAARV